jgi:hypothetical protein
MGRIDVILHMPDDWVPKTQLEYKSFENRLQSAIDKEYPYARMGTIEVIMAFENKRQPTSEETDG